MPTKKAVLAGITDTAGVVTSAALIMVAVFAIYGTLSMQDFKQLGAGLAVAVFLDDDDPTRSSRTARRRRWMGSAS